jgi:hypothetical protein
VAVDAQYQRNVEGKHLYVKQGLVAAFDLLD